MCTDVIEVLVSYRNLMEDIDIHRIDSPSFFALGKL